MSHILIVDDEESICWGLERLLTGAGHTVTRSASAEDAIFEAGRVHPDLVLLDVRLPGIDGLAAMEQLSAASGGATIVVMTAFGSLDVATTAMRQGAFDYLIKPFDLDAAMSVVSRALSTPHATQRAPQQRIPDTLVGDTPAMQEVFKRIAFVATTDCPVLITGESGTGKELVARAIHDNSPRAGGPFVPIHLAALSPTLVDSELFGHARGAFSGAETARRGLLEMALGGTAFFDEAGDIPLETQVKLLRVLEHGEVTPVGESKPQPTQFRVIAATQQQLATGGENVFRRDLYYRLAVFEIKLPPLRQRKDDIPGLARQFLTSAQGPEHPGFSDAAIEELRSRTWLGNVRELRNAVEHGLVMARGGAIGVEHLPPPLAYSSQGSLDPETLLREAVRAWTLARLAQSPTANLHEEFLACAEPALLEAVLTRTQQNRTKAAEVLGLHRATLRKKLN